MKSLAAFSSAMVERLEVSVRGASRARRASPKRFQPRCESLEHRRMLAVTMLKDLNPLPGSGSIPYYLANVNGTLFFTASDGAHGDELWKSDGTPAGTVLVKDIEPGPSGSSPSYLTNADGTLFFFTGDGPGEAELWKSDGTEAGTVRLKDFGSEGSYYYGYYLASVGGTLFFTAYDDASGAELWMSDGTEAGTVRVTDIRPGSDDYGYGFGSYPSYLTNVGGTLFFTADDGVSGTELWKSDGTASGTVRVKDISPGRDDYGYPYSSYPYYLTNVGGMLYFTADDGVDGRELWRSDGTAVGTVLVKDIRPGNDDYGYPFSSDPTPLASLGDTLYFTADDGVSGNELWKSDGTSIGTVQVKDIAPGLDGISISPSDVADVNGTLYLFLDGGRGGLDELWKSDGTENGTMWVADILPRIVGRYGSDPARQPTDVNGTLYFVAVDGHPPPPCPRCAFPPGNSELWTSDGTEEGTLPVAEINAGEEGSFPSFLTRIGGMLFFSADDGVHGEELWVLTPDVVDAPGDTDGDGDVDLTDLNNVRNHFGGTGTGDADGDGDVDLDDLQAVRNNFGAKLPAPIASSLSAVATSKDGKNLRLLDSSPADAVFAQLAEGHGAQTPFQSPRDSKRAYRRVGV